MTWYRKLTAAEIRRFDGFMPPAGPCAFCGGTDKRHRMTDALVGYHRAGDSPKSIADDVGLPIAAVRFLVRLRLWGGKQWRIRSAQAAV